MKKFLKPILITVLSIVLLVGCFFGYLTVTEYNPDAVIPVQVKGIDGGSVRAGENISVLSWNIGYCGLGRESDFFMDGGKDTRSADKATSLRYLDAIHSFVESENADITLLQEVDKNSTRSYHTDQTEVLSRGATAYALNYSCDFVPFPLPPIGKVESGVFTSSLYSIEDADRIALPCPFTWPVRTANLKRCMLVSYLPVEGNDNYLVMINVHLEAYDSGEGKIAQTNMLRDFIADEYAKGNYVIVGGDFNQSLPGGSEKYRINHPELWAPGTLEESLLPDGFRFAYDVSAPTCRLLNQPYDPSDTENTDYYVIDGFIVSPNVEISSVETVSLDFENSDHNPVRLSVKLLEN